MISTQGAYMWPVIWKKKIPGKSEKMAKFCENGGFDRKHNLFAPLFQILSAFFISIEKKIVI